LNHKISMLLIKGNEWNRGYWVFIALATKMND
jgi:hypothetical protein